MDIALNDLDIKILQLLRADAQMVLKDIADKLDSKPSTIHNRIKKLEDSGVIRKHTIDINLDTIGYNLSSFVMLKYDKNEATMDQDGVAEALSDLKRVQEVHLISGEFDILIKVRAKDIDDLGNFVTKELKDLKGIYGSRSYISLSNVKETNQSPFVIDLVERDN